MAIVLVLLLWPMGDYTHKVSLNVEDAKIFAGLNVQHTDWQPRGLFYRIWKAKVKTI